MRERLNDVRRRELLDEWKSKYGGLVVAGLKPARGRIDDLEGATQTVWVNVWLNLRKQPFPLIRSNLGYLRSPAMSPFAASKSRRRKPDIAENGPKSPLLGTIREQRATGRNPTRLSSGRLRERSNHSTKSIHPLFITNITKDSIPSRSPACWTFDRERYKSVTGRLSGCFMTGCCVLQSSPGLDHDRPSRATLFLCCRLSHRVDVEQEFSSHAPPAA